MKVSNCCGYEIGDPYYLDIGLCPACKEHCDFEEIDEEEENECDHKNAYFFHDNAPKYCPDCDKYIDGNKVLNTINTENEQRNNTTTVRPDSQSDAGCGI